MIFVIQRVIESSVSIDGEVCGSINKGFMVLIGIGEGDNEAVCDKMVRNLVNMRIFEDENGKTNLGLSDVNGELLLISQFTLYADCKKGNRPSFTQALEPVESERLYNYIVDECKKSIKVVETGRFGADMKVSLVNDGPFTIVLDSEKI